MDFCCHSQKHKKIKNEKDYGLGRLKKRVAKYKNIELVHLKLIHK